MKSEGKELPRTPKTREDIREEDSGGVGLRQGREVSRESESPGCSPPWTAGCNEPETNWLEPAAGPWV